MEARYLTDLEWRICHAVNIYVFRNGRDGEQPVLVHIPPAKKKNMRTVMGVVQDRVKYPVGYAKFLYKMDGTRVKDPCELEMYNNYVVASNFDKYFKCAAYGRKRSPLLVLNRESKHVRVLKLQNQNYYEWLLKKKAVGEERPPYIYPAYYTNENLRPQDLPVGNMGNYHPAEVQAPGCCYPRAEGGRTYRVDGNQKYMVNTVTVDVTPNLGDLVETRKRKRVNKHPDALPKRTFGNKQGGKVIKERTPSDMINANVLASSDTSQEVVSVSTSETDQLKLNPKGHRLSKQPHSHRQPKSTRNHAPAGAGDFPEKQGVNDSSEQSSEDLRRNQKKSGRKSKKREREAPVTGMLPPPPLQFRDNVDVRNNNVPVKPSNVDSNDNQEILKYVDRAIHNPVINFAAAVNPQKTFFYSPEKLAEINSSGNIQPLELTFTNHHPCPSIPTSQWAVIRPQQLVQPIYTFDPHLGQNASGINPPQESSSTNPPSVLPTFRSTQPQPTNQQLLQSVPVPLTNLQQQYPSTMHAPALSSSSSSSQPVYQSQQNLAPTHCVMIPANMSQHLALPQSTQLIALPNPSGQNHLQQVYQLGIVQQPNPQACIQVDARAMRQYVDNQKLIEERFQQVPRKNHPTNREQHEPRGGHHSRHPNDLANQHSCTDLTESEVDIPFTPLKTYRLHPKKMESPPSLVEAKRHGKSKMKASERSSNRQMYHHERLPKIKSRNVAIQMGFPGASARTARQFSNFLDPFNKGSHSSEISFILERNRNMFNNDGQSERFSSSGCLLEAPTPRTERDRFLMPNTNNSRDYRSLRRSTNFGSCYSEQYLGLNSSRIANVDRSNDSKVLNRTPRHRSSDPILEELVTIPPPTEFRESLRYPGRTRPPQDNYNDKPTHYSNHKYHYSNNERPSLQYMYDQYP